MAEDIMSRSSSRRGLLAAGAAAAAAAAAASFARYSPASAADGDTVTVGSSNEGTSVTSFNIKGDGGIAATSDTAKAVAGTSTSGQGVHGTSSSSAGVAGVSDSGNAVHGTSTSSRGVYGQSTSGPGVEGSGAVGVKAESSGGYALETTQGAVKFTGISGIATIPSGDTVITVKPGVSITNSTLMLLTPEGNIGNHSVWFTKPGNAGEINIHISSARSNPTKVAYLVVDHG